MWTVRQRSTDVVWFHSSLPSASENGAVHVKPQRFALASIGNHTSILTEPLPLCLSCILLVRIGSASFSLMLSIAYFILALFFFYPSRNLAWPCSLFHLLIFPSLFILFQLLLIKKTKQKQKPPKNMCLPNFFAPALELSLVYSPHH